MKKSYLKVPAKFESLDYLSQITQLNQKNCDKGIAVDETYGCIPLSHIGNAKAAKDLFSITLEQLSTYISESNIYGLKFNYLINSIWSQGIEFYPEGQKQIIHEIQNLVSCGVENVIVSSPGIIQIIKNEFPALNITLSTNIGICSLHEIFRWQEVGVDKIVLNRNINRDMKLLKEIQNSTPIKIELLLNSMCNLFCSQSQYHNLINNTNSNLKTQKFIDSNNPQSQCNCNCVNKPCEMICAAWIRPEDVCLYEKIGYSSFKLDGRGMNCNHMLFVIEEYLQRYHEGNFFDLFDFWDSSTNIKSSLNNRFLDGLVQTMMDDGVNCQICGGRNVHCKKIASKIIFQNI